MRSSLLRKTRLAVVALAVLAVPILAAPVRKTETGLRIGRYLLDDVDGVLVINVKQIVASPAYKKGGFAKQFADLVARPEAQEYLKNIGFDPLKDIEQVIVCNSKSCHRANDDTPDNDDGPFILFQGKFDSAKLKEKMAAIAKDHPDKVSSSDAPGGQKIYRIDPRHGPFAAQLDSNTVVIAGRKAHVLDALLKASGKKTTKYAHKAVPEHIKKLKPDVAVQGFALTQMIYTTRYSSKDNGMGKRVFTRENVTLGEKGFAGATLTITVKDEAAGSIAWTVKDKDQVKKLNDEFTQGLEEMRQRLRRQVAREPNLAPVQRFVDAATIKSKGQTITMEGKADSEVVQAMFQSIFGFGR